MQEAYILFQYLLKQLDLSHKALSNNADFSWYLKYTWKDTDIKELYYK